MSNMEEEMEFDPTDCRLPNPRPWIKRPEGTPHDVVNEFTFARLPPDVQAQYRPARHGGGYVHVSKAG